MLIYCHTPKAIVLLQRPDENGMLRFFQPTPGSMGLDIDVEPLKPVSDQILDRVESYLGESLTIMDLEVDPDIKEQFEVDGTCATLYLARVSKTLPEISEQWSTFPSLLRSLPQDRRRIPYIKVWQRLMGADKDQLHAVEIEDVLASLQVSDSGS